MKTLSIKFKNGKISSVKEINEDYYSLNLDVVAKLKLYGFATDAPIASGMNKLELIIDINRDLSKIDSNSKFGVNYNKTFCAKLEFAKEIKSMLREKNLNWILGS